MGDGRRKKNKKGENTEEVMRSRRGYKLTDESNIKTSTLPSTSQTRKLWRTLKITTLITGPTSRPKLHLYVFAK